MDLDDQLRRYFGTADFSAIPPAALEAGIERMKVDLGLEKDRGNRFALWALLLLGPGASVSLGVRSAGGLAFTVVYPPLMWLRIHN